MIQPCLDLTNYEKPHDPSMYEGMQDFLCNAPKTDGRFGFNCGSRIHDSGFVFAGITPYGMQVMEAHFIEAILTFGVFNHKFLKMLCESPLPDASVINLVDNAIRMRLEDEVGKPTQYVMTHVGHINPYGHRKGKLTWSACGCDCLIEWDGHCRFTSLTVADYVNTTGRMKVIPLAERMCPRHGCMHELKYYPHPNPVDWRGKPITEEMILADVTRYRERKDT